MPLRLDAATILRRYATLMVSLILPRLFISFHFFRHYAALIFATYLRFIVRRHY